MMIESELVPMIENPETGIIRLNSETISFLGGCLIEAQDIDLQLKILDMIEKHSTFVLEASATVASKKASGNLRSV